MPRTARKGHRTDARSLARVRGFVHLQLIDNKTGRILGETRIHNVVVGEGKQNYIVGSIGAVAGSKQINRLALATQSTSPATTDGTVAGEFGGRKTSTNTFVSPGTLRMTASWAGSDLGTDSPKTIGSIAAFNTSSGGSMACAATYTTSQWTSDQSVNATYELQFT